MSVAHIDYERRARVNALTLEIVAIVSSMQGITIEDLHARFPSDGHTHWDVSGALDIVTGFTDKTKMNAPIEVQRGRDGARHLVLRDSTSPSFTTHTLHPLRLWL